jgi:hypothetical protein
VSAGALPRAGLEAESQLPTHRRIRLYIRNPRDAFSIVSPREQLIDASWVFVLSFAVKLPVVLQKHVAAGRQPDWGLAEWVVLGVAGLLLGVAATVVGILAGALVLHGLLNGMLRAGRSYGDAVRLLVLCMAPTLLLVLEYPTLLLAYTEQSTVLVFAVLRLVAGVLMFRTLYWGLRGLFGQTARVAIAVTLVPAGLLLLLGAALAAATLNTPGA